MVRRVLQQLHPRRKGGGRVGRVVAPIRRALSWPGRWPLHVRMGLLAVVVVAAGVSVALYQQHRMYTLSAAEQKLIRGSTVDQKFIESVDGKISYNRQAEARSKTEQQLTLASNDLDASGDRPYRVELAASHSEGMTFSDASTDAKDEKQFKLVPLFEAGSARYEEGRVVYPEGINRKHVYTFRNNGIKEDIILSKFVNSEVTYSWRLELGDDLEAKMMSDGSVGIFSASPMLLGDVQTSSDKDRALLEKARKNAPKDHLAFVLPAPYIVDAGGNKHYEDVSFTLDGDRLTLTARNLENKTYPLSIDPTVVVSTTSDFRQGVDDGMIDYAYPDDIQRSQISAGTVGATTVQASAFTAPRLQHSSVVYNGYLYIVGGVDSTSAMDDIIRCPVNPNGSVDTCVQQTNKFTTERYEHASVVYNGYLYIIGGNDFSGSMLDDIIRCPLDPSTGAAGTCVQQTSAFTTARSQHGAIVYNGYLYIVGGFDGGVPLDDIIRCPLNADGTVGTCSSNATGFVAARQNHATAIHNGYIYVIGGLDSSSVLQNDIQYCLINSDGTVATCTQQAAAFTGARIGHVVAISNGYLYITGGFNGTTNVDTIQYCPLNANGSVGTCTANSTGFTTARDGHTSVVYGKYLYIIGGLDNSSNILNDVQRLAIDVSAPSGIGSVGTTTQQTNAISHRGSFASVVSGGYLYVIGGADDGPPLGDIQYCPIHESGSVGSCTTQNSIFTTARYGHTAVVHDNYLYIIGGYGASSLQNDIQYCYIDPSTHAVSACTQQTNAFTTARQDHSSVVYNGYLYIIGGGSSVLDDIQYCPINATTHAVGTCTQQTSAFTTARYSHTSVVYNGFLYIIGGYSSGYLNDIQYCPISATGAVGTCTQQTSAFTTARYLHTSVIYNGYLYIVGGNSSTDQNDVQRCPLGATGAAGTCTQQTAAFTTARRSHQSVAYNGYLYIIGGYGGVNAQSDIQRLPISSPGNTTLGSVGTSTRINPAFTQERDGLNLVMYGNYLYIAGSNIGGYLDIQYCPLDPITGAPGACSTSSNVLPDVRQNVGAVAYNGFLYMPSGINAGGQTDIARCPLDPDTGAPGTCTEEGTITTARWGHGVVVWNDYIYIIGGATGVNTGFQNDIQRCPLDPDNGDVGTCIQQTNAFTTARQNMAVAVYNDMLYISGGDNPTGQSDIQYCPIDSTTGAVGTCTQQAGVLPTARNFLSSEVYNGYLYILGGFNGGLYNGDVVRCPLNATTGVPGTCVEQSDVFVPRSNHDSAVHNGVIYIGGGLTEGSTQNDDIEYFRTNAPMHRGTYEKTIDIGGEATTVDSMTISGETECGYNVSYATAATDGVFGSVVSLEGVVPGASNSLEIEDARYIRLLVDMDDSICGDVSTIKAITFEYTREAKTPVLNGPTAGFIGTTMQPVFTLRAADPEGSYLRYKIEVCSNADCTSILRTIDQTASQTGWSGQDQQTSTAYTGNVAITSSTMATHTYQTPALSMSTQYWWRAYAIDPGDTNTWSEASAIQTFTTQSIPSAPTLVSPANNDTGFNGFDALKLRSSDADSDYLQYKIEVCSTSNCSVILRTIDQTSSQTGWSGQDASSNTAYTSSPTVGSSAVAMHFYQPPILAPGTQYWWRAYAIDPAGNNAWSSASSIQSFTIGTNQVRILGGVDIRGSTKIAN